MLLLLLGDDDRIIGCSSQPEDEPNYTVRLESGTYPTDIEYKHHKYTDGVFIYVNPLDGFNVIEIAEIDGAIELSHAAGVWSGYENTAVTISGICELDDCDLRVAIFGNQNQKYLFDAIVRDGIFTTSVNFPNSGEFKLKTDSVTNYNDDLKFHIPQMLFRITRGVDSVILEGSHEL